MSLILEALKKLEREKKTDERGFLVTTRAAWPAGGVRPLGYVLAGAGLLGVGAFGTWLMLGGSRRPPEGAFVPTPMTTLQRVLPQPAATVPAPAPLPTRGILPPASPATSRLATRPAPRRPAASPTPNASSEPAPEPSDPAELRLEAVSRRDGQPIAVVSGHLVHEGDVFGDVRVIRIGDTEVEIEVGGKRRVLSF